MGNKAQKLKIPDEVARLIRCMHPNLKKKVRTALNEILADPSSGKTLRRELKGLNSYRVGRLRIIYRIISKNFLEIIAVGPRKVIYEETYRLIKKESQS